MTEPGRLTLAYLATRPVEAARVLERLEPETVGAFLADVPVRVAAGPLAAMVPWRAGRCLAAMAPRQAAALLESLPAEHGVDCLRPMADGVRAAVLESLPARRARALRRQLRYPAALVGAHMDADPLVLRATASADEARGALRTAGRGGALQVHVVDERGRPRGAVRLADLLDAPGERTLDTLMARPGAPLAADLPLARVERARGWADWPERAVVDAHERLVGSITLARIAAAAVEPGARLTAGPAPLAVLLQAYAATAAGLARVAAGLFTERGGTHRGR